MATIQIVQSLLIAGPASLMVIALPVILFDVELGAAWFLGAWLLLFWASAAWMVSKRRKRR